MTRTLPDYIVSYLNKYSLKEYEIEWKYSSGINNVIVIPSIAEFENINILLFSLTKNDSKFFNSTLVLFVVNNSVSSTMGVKADNQKSLDFLRSIIFNNENDKLINEINLSGISIGLIDAASNGKELE